MKTKDKFKRTTSHLPCKQQKQGAVRFNLNIPNIHFALVDISALEHTCVMSHDNVNISKQCDMVTKKT